MTMKLLGVPKYEPGRKEKENQVGLVTGLCVTQAGGDTLATEATLMPGKGKLIVTGILSDMMKESAQAALSYVRSRSKRFNIDDKVFENNDVHVHCPTGIPKDGNSAGVTIATAILSAITRIPVHREVAMTGEVTLRGRVLPIGGLKEKVLAAHRAASRPCCSPGAIARTSKRFPQGSRRGSPHAREARRRDPQGRAGDGEA